MLAVVRIRGRVGVRKEVEDTLRMLRLKRINHCVVLPDTPSYRGMLMKVKDYVAFGKLDFETFLELLRRRGRLVGERKLDEESVKETGFNTIEELAEAIYHGKVRMADVRNLKPVFRLHPPSKGHKSIKKHYPRGSLGDWGEGIADLIRRMV